MLPGARPGSKTKFVVAKLYVHFLRNGNYTDTVNLYFHNMAAAVVLGWVADRITNITKKCMHKINNLAIIYSRSKCLLPLEHPDSK